MIKNIPKGYTLFLIVFLLLMSSVLKAQEPRISISLNSNWRSVADDYNPKRYDGFENPDFKDQAWEKVQVPHNWDKYHGYRRMLHGNRHGYAWYRKSFKINQQQKNKRYFLYFEGVGSYATVWLNGKKLGYHAGGRTTFTLDVSAVIKLNGEENILAVRADHPAEIRDLPWVDGGCSTERGFSEGSQPMGIFRPVHLVITDAVRIEPFGVHIWNDKQISAKAVKLFINTELKNYSAKKEDVLVLQEFKNHEGKVVFTLRQHVALEPQATKIAKQETTIQNPRLWSLENPYLYQLQTKIIRNNKITDKLTTPYGIRWISWPIGEEARLSKQFLLNGKPVFINGIAEYEHLIGNSHAFSDEQIRSRVLQMKGAGFNAFRDAHQPHNLLYQIYWDKLGILSWTQMAAHIWFDNEAFRTNFKNLLKDWVKERRNSPSVVLWGLENESTLPEDFAKECSALIRSLDPTASSQRKITTCNGGSGTDWDVPQNWTGTYGGNPLHYGEDLKRQILVGEYGAWRTLEAHSEGPHLPNVSDYNEDRFTELMETKVRLADSVKNEVAGHYFWLWTSHDNPGRVQGGEGLRELDRIGPVNYKGLLTPWEEPLDAYYMFRSNFAPKDKEPMVYIASHTWPQRWTSPGVKNNIRIYSNCDEVELFNDLDASSLGRRTKNGIGTHFRWDGVMIKYNILYAIAYVNGKAVARDTIVLQNLPKAPNFNLLYEGAQNITASAKAYNYLYRVNCGGPDYQDENGQTWIADRQLQDKNVWGSTSWASTFDLQPNFFASQRRTFDPIKGTKDWALFQDFRYGRDELSYHFPVPDGEYLLELYFTEPWLGTGGGIDCTGFRLFDVAVNDEVVLDDLDIWKESGHDGALKKAIKVQVKGGVLKIHFPEVKAGQALISAIAIASLNQDVKVENASVALIKELQVKGDDLKETYSLDIGQHQFTQSDETFVSLPSVLYGANWLKSSGKALDALSFKANAKLDFYIGIKQSLSLPQWIKDFEDTQTFVTNNKGTQYRIYKKKLAQDEWFSIRDFKQEKGIFIAYMPENNLQPAFDLKKNTSYKAALTTLDKGVEKHQLMNQERLIFKADHAQIKFNIKVGVADTYSLTVKYHNPFKELKQATISVIAADGTLMKAAELFDLEPSKEGKWSYFNTTTGTMINAGTYQVIIQAKDAIGISVDALDVQ
ncbi:malectin domain-containing carbohydrate-binding protein [Pedobacter glucosidilyticus]|uniref:malectin domain-containing carbohydrate-binding protein n=1 Tax=Pedobacter glucosidilyticus TaxID=1122941 RepID=UPI000564D58F|nr:malectin domain-containing carbohydrate-binding protein [Pedobacter glucosidilyticus]